ncbi:MAG: hypothetical protein ACOVLG_06865 [Flavobacterium sp.]
MKKLNLISLLFLLSFSAFSQIRLSVHLKRSQSENDINLIVDTLKIYKDNLLFKNIGYPDSYALYENVSNGEYKFCYNNLFGERIEKTVKLDEANNQLGGQEINLFIDQLQNPKSRDLLVLNLKNKDTLTINLKFSGCFNSGADSIKVYKKNSYYFLKYKNQKRKLKSRDIEALVKYETELKSLPEVNFVSTSNALNEIIVNEEKFTYFEHSFFWGGYTILKKSLKLK